MWGLGNFWGIFFVQGSTIQLSYDCLGGMGKIQVELRDMGTEAR